VRLEVGAALALGKPFVFVLDCDVARGGAPDAAALLREGRAQQEQALAKAGADAAAVERVRALTDAQWAALEARAAAAPPIVFRRGLERLFAETMPPLAAALGLGARVAAAPVDAPFRMRRALAAKPGACDVLVVAAEAGADQAAFLQLGLQRRCARRALVVRQMEGAGVVADVTSSGAAGASVSIDVSAIASAGASASAADEAAADAAVAGAASVLLVMTERFFEDARVATTLRAALRRKLPVELVWERHYQHGGVERFEYFFGREAVLDHAGVARVPALPATPAELQPLYANAMAIELERRAEKREPMLDALLPRLRAVRAYALGGRLPPPPLPLGFLAAPVEETVGMVARLLVGGQGCAGEGAIGEGAGATSAASTAGEGSNAAASPAASSSFIPHLPYRIIASGGLGGAGKTTLATAVIRRAEVRAAFDDVYWLTLGRVTEREQLLAKMRVLIDEVGGGEIQGLSAASEVVTGELKTVEAATKRLCELLRTRRILVVVDDVWTRDHFAAFIGAIEGGSGAAGSNAAAAGAATEQAAAAGSSLLFTTRYLDVFRRAVESAAVRAKPAVEWARLGNCAAVDAAELAPGPARAFLAAAAGIAPAHAAGLDFARVFAAVGTLLLPLFIIGACARRQLEPLGGPDREAERDVVARIASALVASGRAASGGASEDNVPVAAPAHGTWLENARFRAALRAQNPDSAGRYAPTFAAISLALGSLSATDALAFASLGLFPEDSAVHEAVVAAAWRMGDAPERARALLERLQAAGLAKLEAAGGAEAAASGGAAGGGASAAPGLAVMLHDLARDFAAAICASQAGGTAAWHGSFLARLAQLMPEGAAAEGACRPWWRLGEEKKHGAVAAFAAEHLLSHLRAAGLRDEAATLAFRLPWLQFVLRRRGMIALVDDLERNLERSEENGLLLETLKLSLPGLVIGDGDEAADSLLPGQVLGRVSAELGAKWPATLGALRGECWDWRGPREWIRPARAYFTAPSGPLKATLEGHSGDVRCVAVLPDGRVMSGSRDMTLRVWDASSGACERVLEGHSGGVLCVALLRDGRFVSGSEDKTLRVWDALSGVRERMLVGHANDVLCVAVLPDGRVVSGSADETLRVWDASSGICEHTLEGHAGGVSCVAVLPDGRVVSGSNDKTLRLWDALSGTRLHVLEGHEEKVLCLAVLSDGRVVSGSRDKMLRVWDASSGICELTLVGHSGDVTCIAALPDRRVVSGSYDETLRVWDALSGLCLCTLEGHKEKVLCVAVLSDESVVSGSRDKTLRVWNASSGVSERTLVGHSGGVTRVAVLPDGRVVSGSLDKTLRVWDASSGTCVRVVQHSDSDFATLTPYSSGKGHSSLAKSIGLRHSGPLLSTSSARIHVGEWLTASNAERCVAGLLLVGGSVLCKVWSMTVVESR
jgi:WD40 repeat protein